MYSVSQGTDLPKQTTTQQFLDLASPPLLTKSLDDFTCLTNNTYTDFRPAYKPVLIPSYVIQVI